MVLWVLNIFNFYKKNIYLYYSIINMSDNSFAGINFNDPETMQIFATHEKMMCPQYKENDESMFSFDIKTDTKNNKNIYIINGRLNGQLGVQSTVEKLFVKYSAANPPTYSSNFSGSGLPYPNIEVAFENTPNKGVVEINNMSFNFSIRYPNSYYKNMGSLYVPPEIKLVVVNRDNKELSKVEVFNLGQGIPFRTLTWPTQRNWNNGPLFYRSEELPVRTQYQILLDSAYPTTNKTPKNFWGATPPH